MEPIQAFQDSISQSKKTSNEKCKLNPAKTASMLQVNTYELKMNNALIENTITLTP